MKSSGTAAVGFLVVIVLWRLAIGGNLTLVWCRWKTPCLLEANFPIGDDVAIHWKRVSPSKLQVHSFYYEKDQLQEQDQHFRGRTSLFKENIPKGNASLLLTNVLVADEGTYMCYVGTLTRQWRYFIKLNVVAAVTSIRLRLNNEDQLICSSGGIFPQPELRWSTEPASPDALRNSSQVQQETQTQLYNINGSLALAGYADPDLEYICDVSTTNSSRRITWRKTSNRDVWCRWKTPCLLEANFPIGDDVVIHWERESPSKLKVHSFYYEQDQPQGQDQHFRGRTSLFKENIPKGNASLLLTNVLVADEGTYMCYVGTLTGQWRSFIKLNVEAAVTSIRFRPDDEDQLICSSGGIFPRPELRWSTEPALPDALRNSSQVQQETQTQLYNIDGSLVLAGDAHPDLEYICDVSTTNSSRRITWRKTILDISVAETSIECAPVSHPSSLEWTFNRSNVIANRSAGHKLHIVSDWKEHVKGVSEAGALNLSHLSAKQSGTYTCTFSNNTETRVQDILLTVTGTEDVSPKAVGITLGVLGTIGVGIYCRCRCCSRQVFFGISRS